MTSARYPASEEDDDGDMEVELMMD